MTTQTEALKLALEALELSNVNHWWGHSKIEEAITAIKEALAQQCVCGEPNSAGTHRTDGPCFAPQPEQCKYGQEPKSCTSSPMDCQCAIDATLAQPEQESTNLDRHKRNVQKFLGNAPQPKEPEHDKERCVGCEACIDTACGRDECPNGWPKVPQRTWVGLTDEERDNFWKADQMTSKEWGELFDAIEAKFKEKNT